MLDEVRGAAHELLAALENARRQTGEWEDSHLADSLVDRALSQCMARLARTECWGRANQVPSGELWKIAGGVLESGVLQLRARAKPLGYAGDYQMLAWICEQTCCDHPLGRYFDRYFLRQAAPEAVRGRTQLAAAKIAAYGLAHAGATHHIVSVGVGPGLDLAAAVQMLDVKRHERLKITLVDLDAAGLEFAAQQIRPYLRADQVQVVRENLFRLSQKPQAIAQMADADFLLCTGLFDYLDDVIAAEMLSLFWRVLAPQGELMVGNFAPHCPTRAYMEWIGNWYLNYRRAEELATLAEAAGLASGSWTIGAESLGVDLFISAKRT
ncbi:MAG: class I SAM-dependent methyltransferase [Planctomycetia bacterium]|nr:class I SAM-dependent methyltransferase [Planctomycetia bacterium]